MKGVGNHVIQGLCSAGLILCLGGAAVAAANDNETTEKPTAQEKSDNKLSKQIESRIEHDKTLKNRNINTEVSGGTVTLTGTVASSSEKMKAEKLAKVKGVSDIDNQIEVQGDHGSEPGATPSDGSMNEEKGQPQEQPQRRTEIQERSETRTEPVPAEPRTTQPTPPDIENPSMPERSERPVPSPSNPAPSTPPPSNNLPGGSPSPTTPPSNPGQTP
jgi:hyperosmotically inducible protein